MKRILSLSPSEKNQDKRSKSTSANSSPNSSPVITAEMDTTTPTKLNVISKKYSKEDLVELVKSMGEAIVALQDQNSKLIYKVRTLTNSVADLKKSMESAPTTKKTFAEMLSTGLSAPSAQVTIMNAAKLAQNSDDRQSAVIIRGAQLSSDDSKDKDLVKSVAEECKTSGDCSVFRIHLKDSPPLLKLRFESKMEATKVLASFNSIKNHVTGLHDATIRPDLSKPELAKYRESWKDAIKKNNEVGQRIWTVRNLETVKIPYKDGQTPHPWTVRHQNK